MLRTSQRADYAWNTSDSRQTFSKVKTYPSAIMGGDRIAPELEADSSDVLKAVRRLYFCGARL
jgi:hypothetical protein